MSQDNPSESPPENLPENSSDDPKPELPEVPEWGKSLQETVSGLIEKIDALAGLNNPPDESPSGKPWTHKKFW